MAASGARPRDRLRLACRLAAAAIMLAAATAALPAVAHADGDPASDVLVSQAAFVPWDADVSQAAQARLLAVLAAANRAGLPIRVALISSAADLGSVTALWRQPQNYADFLGVELSLVYGGRVLVVMPDGVGLYARTTLPRGELAAVAGLAPGSGAGLATGAVAAVQRLAAASGHALPVTRAVPAGGPAHRSAPVHAVSWIAFLVGAALIALAWAASLRARRPRLPLRRVRST